MPEFPVETGDEPATKHLLIFTFGPLGAKMDEIAGKLESHSGRLDAIAAEIVTTVAQLNSQIPESKRAQSAADEALQQLSKRDKEVSDKLKQSFLDVEAQLVEMRVQSEATASAQRDVHTVVARQKADLDGVRLEVGRYVQETLASVQTQAASGGDGGKGGGGPPREREAPQLNDPKKNEVDVLSDSMSKASFVLWRDNLDLHLEGCNDFGMGTGEMLKRVRLHPRIIDRTVMNDFNTAVRQEGQMTGNMLMLTRWDTSRADRELYKFLHTKLTVGLKATSVLTCQSGMGFELYRIINKKLDPNNSISEHTILADFRRLALAKAKDLMETRKRVVQLVALCNEYCDKTGKEVELQEKTFAVWMFMDDDSKEQALRKNLVEGDAAFSIVCDHLEAISSEQGNREAIAAYAKAQAPVKMDLSALAPPSAGAEGLGAPPPPGGPSEPGAELDAFGAAKCYKCGDGGHR